MQLPARVKGAPIKEVIQAMPVRVRREGAGGEGPWRLAEIFGLSLRQAIAAWQDWAAGKEFRDEEFRGEEFPVSEWSVFHGSKSLSAIALEKMDDSEWEFDYHLSPDARERDGASSPVLFGDS